MNLLLLLSAMLSALTGAISGVRVEEAHFHARAEVVSGAQAAVAIGASAVAVRRSHLALAPPASIADEPAMPFSAIGWTLAAPAPLYLGRLRE